MRECVASNSIFVWECLRVDYIFMREWDVILDLVVGKLPQGVNNGSLSLAYGLLIPCCLARR